MAFAPMTLASPPSPACLCPRISNSFAAYLVLVITVSSCLMAYHIRPVTALLKKGAAFEFASAVEDTVRTLLAELAAPPILVFPDWDAFIDTSRPLRLHCGRQHRWSRRHPRTRTTRWLPYAPSSTSAEPPSTMSRIGPLRNSKPDASCGASDPTDATYPVCTSSFSLTISASNKSVR